MQISEPKKKKIKKQIYFAAEATLNKCSETQQFILEAGADCKQNNPKIKCVKPDYCFGCFFAKPKMFKKVNYKYYQAVVKKGKDTELVKFETLPACDVLAFEYVGSYKKLKKAYKFVHKWLKKNGIGVIDIISPIREVYIDGPWNKEDPNEYKTELQVPIKKEAK